MVRRAAPGRGIVDLSGARLEIGHELLRRRRGNRGMDRERHERVGEPDDGREVGDRVVGHALEQRDVLGEWRGGEQQGVAVRGATAPRLACRCCRWRPACSRPPRAGSSASGSRPPSRAPGCRARSPGVNGTTMVMVRPGCCARALSGARAVAAIAVSRRAIDQNPAATFSERDFQCLRSQCLLRQREPLLSSDPPIVGTLSRRGSLVRRFGLGEGPASRPFRARACASVRCLARQ